jgi:hypothetical protein
MKTATVRMVAAFFLPGEHQGLNRKNPTRHIDTQIMRKREWFEPFSKVRDRKNQRDKP